MLFKRTLYDELKEYLYDDEIIVLHGSRQVGKTSLLKYILQEEEVIAHNQVFFDLEITENLELCNMGAGAFFEYLTNNGFISKNRLFVFIDEIQYLDNPSSFLKILYDHHRDKIKLIVTGSSTFSIKSKFSNSLVGRTINFELFPLSFKEYLLFNNIKTVIDQKITLPIVINELKKYFYDFVRWGGYPAIVLEKNVNKKKRILNQIISTYIKADIRDIGNIRNITKFNKLLVLLASQIGNLVNITELSNTVGLAKATIEDYLFVLENTYIIRLVKPFYKNFRSEITKMPKIYFEDTGIANLLLKKNSDAEITGASFENAIFCELRKTYDVDSINYWRTIKKHEIDFILNFREQLVPLEIKTNFRKKRPTSLLYFKEKYEIAKSYLCRLEQQNENPYDWLELLYPWELQNKFFAA